MAHWLLLISIFVLTGCFSESTEVIPAATSATDLAEDSGDCLTSGDVLVVNQGADGIVAFDSNGVFKKIVTSSVGNTQTYAGITYLEETDELLVAVDGTDRIEAIDLETCQVRNFILNANIALTVTSGITQLSGGDVIVSEGNTVERINVVNGEGIRNTTSGWPKTLQTTGTNLYAGASNSFIQCSTGTDKIRWYDNSGTQIGSDVSSGIAATTDAVDCMVLADGTVAGVWSGTTDTLAIYSSDLTTTIKSYSNVSILSTPRGLAEDEDGNIYVADYTLGYVVKLDSDLNLVSVFGQGILNLPAFIYVIP